MRRLILLAPLLSACLEAGPIEVPGDPACGERPVAVQWTFSEDSRGNIVMGRDEYIKVRNWMVEVNTYARCMEGAHASNITN